MRAHLGTTPRARDGCACARAAVGCLLHLSRTAEPYSRPCHRQVSPVESTRRASCAPCVASSAGRRSATRRRIWALSSSATPLAALRTARVSSSRKCGRSLLNLPLQPLLLPRRLRWEVCWPPGFCAPGDPAPVLCTLAVASRPSSPTLPFGSACALSSSRTARRLLLLCPAMAA